MPTQIIDKGWDNIKRSYALMNGAEVKIGYMDGGGQKKLSVHKSDDPNQKTPITLAKLAFVMEYGAEITITDKMRGWFYHRGVRLKKSRTTIKIPERPFMRFAFDQNNRDLTNFVSMLLAQLDEGKETPNTVLHKAGIWFVGKIQETIAAAAFPKNSPLTILWKGSSKPLIAGGQLRQSADYEVKL